MMPPDDAKYTKLNWFLWKQQIENGQIWQILVDVLLKPRLKQLFSSGLAKKRSFDNQSVNILRR